MWTHIVSKKSADREQTSVTAPNPAVPPPSETSAESHTENRRWGGRWLPSFSSSPTHSAGGGEGRSSFHSDDGERPTLLRRASTDSARDACEQNAECLGGGSEGISSGFSAVPRRRQSLISPVTEASFDLEHVYNNWPSA